MKKFKKGAFTLKEGVTDLVAFEKPIDAQLRQIVHWAEQTGVELAFGTTEDDTYICQYRVVAQTNQLCKGLVAELKAKVKELFPKLSLSYEWSGDCW